jgi:hypothetical protein
MGGKSNLDLGIRYESTGKHFAGGKATNYLGFKLLYTFSI